MKKQASLTAIFAIFLYCPALLSIAQQPTATVRALSGTVLLTIPQQDPVRVNEGDVLESGDVIELKPGASALLGLSDGSEIQLGENTKLDIAVLMQSPQGARTSRLQLVYGRLRAFLSGDHQTEGSSFEVETPNAQVGVKFSQPDVAVSYDPETQTTVVRAYTVDVSVINRLTGAEVNSIPKGQQAIVYDDYILVTKITEVSERSEELLRMTRDKKPAEPEEELAQAKMDLLLATRFGAIGTISDAPGVTNPTTSENPAPGKRTTRPENRFQPVGFTLTVTAE